jgi:putative membrane protein (TIGR04086 family)
MPKFLRSILAVLAGFFSMFLVVIVLTLICVRVLHLKSGHPTPGYLAFNAIYSLAAAILGGYVAARVAGYKPLAHGIALGAVMFVFACLQLLHPAASQPYAYQLLLAVLPPLAAVAGAAFEARRKI